MTAKFLARTGSAQGSSSWDRLATCMIRFLSNHHNGNPRTCTPRRTPPVLRQFSTRASIQETPTLQTVARQPLMDRSSGGLDRINAVATNPARTQQAVSRNPFAPKVMMAEAIDSRNPRQAWHTYSNVCRTGQENPPFTAGTYSRLLHCFQASKAEVPKEWALRVYHDYCQYYTPHLRMLNTLLDLLVSNGDALWAIDFFKKEVARHCLQPDVRSQNIILKGLAKSGRMQEVRQLYDDMRSGHVASKPNVATYSTMISQYFRQGKIDEANAILSDMFHDKVEPNQWIYNLVIKGHALKKDYEGARKVMATMRESNHKPDVVTYTTLINSYAQDGNEEAITQLQEDMEKDGVRPNTHTVTSMLKLFTKIQDKANGDSDEMEKKEEEVSVHRRIEKVLKLTPSEEINHVTIGILVNVYGKHQNLDEAMRLYQQQLKQRKPVNDIIINSLLDAHVKAGQVAKANQLFYKHFTARKIRPKTAWTYSTLISGCNQTDNLEDAEHYFREMQQFRIEPDPISCSRMIQLYLAHKQGDAAERVFKLMLQRKMSISEQTLAMMMDYKGRWNDMRGVLRYFQHIVRLGLKPDAHTYTILINAHIRAENYVGCDATFKHMLESGLRPTLATFTSMMHAHSRAGNVGRVRALWEAMLEAGHSPDLNAYTLLVQTYSRQNNIEMVESIYQEMQDRALKPDVVALATLIRAYGQLPTLNLPRIEELRQQREQLGLEPTSEFYGSLLDAFGSHRMQDRVINTWKEMCALETPMVWCPSTSNLLYLIEACRDRGYVDVLQSVWRHATRGRVNAAAGAFQEQSTTMPPSEGLRVPAPEVLTAYLNALMTHNRFQEVEQSLRQDFVDMQVMPRNQDLELVIGGLAQYEFLGEQLERMRAAVLAHWPQMGTRVDNIISSTRRWA
ncbi:hypothetical protein BGW42_000638 [Actinomortierella wolfii]|nr:hypothetical protein BGW42_000638 [Actinomortierella wolfii]